MSGCSDFSCGLCRLVKRIGRSVRICEGSGVAVRRVRGLDPSTVVLSPNPKGPRSTKVYVSMIGRFRSGVPVIKMYLNRRTVYATFKNAISRTGELVRNGSSGVSLSCSFLFGKLPGRVDINECRSLDLVRSALPSYLRVVSGTGSSNRVVTIGRGSCGICKLRFRPRSVLAPSKLAVVRGFVRGIREKVL